MIRFFGYTLVLLALFLGYVSQKRTITGANYLTHDDGETTGYSYSHRASSIDQYFYISVAALLLGVGAYLVKRSHADESQKLSKEEDTGPLL